MLLQFMKERSLSNVTFAISTVPKKLTWKNMLLMIMKKRNHSNMSFATTAVLKKVTWLKMLYQFWNYDSWIYGFLNVWIIETTIPESTDSWIDSALSRIRFSFMDSWIYRFLKLQILNLRIPESTDSWIYQKLVLSVH